MGLPLIRPFTPTAWFWLASDGRLYASAADATITTSDAGYQAFVANGRVATAWPRDETGAQTNAALYAVLQPYGLGASLAPAPTAADLATYAAAKQITLRDGGITVNIGTTAAPVIVDVASDTDGRGLVTGCIQLIGLASQNSQPAPTFSWINNDGSALSLTAAQMLTIGYDLGAYVQATYVTLGTINAAIANGTITTPAGIDTAAWPATAC